MRPIIFACGLFVGLAGCASDSGVVPIGVDTYMVSKQGWVSTQSVSSLKADAFRDAGAYCASQGKNLQPVNTRETPGQLGRSYPEAEIEFRCLSQGDQELARPTMTPKPDVVIQNQTGH